MRVVVVVAVVAVGTLLHLIRVGVVREVICRREIMTCKYVIVDFVWTKVIPAAVVVVDPAASESRPQFEPNK